ncbi:MAG TPA: sulfur carrier protein ThiS [Acidobacteriaceae bacterium]|nr:sulfur carrier protein ThiS [Acidobacteriaceae bacterium]
MVSTLTVQLNGQARTLEGVGGLAPLDAVIGALELKSDRVAVELNGEIVRRSAWAETMVRGGDRLEIVHFVGGGSPQPEPATGNP